MAFKIIKAGKKEVAVFKATCPICDCVFEFNKEDAEFGEDRDGKYLKLNCPYCGHSIWSWKTNPIRYEDGRQILLGPII